MISKHIRSIGIELECGMSDDGVHKLMDKYRGDRHFQTGSDGSVHVSECDNSGAEYRYWHSSFPKLVEFLKFAYKYAKLNGTCGFHVHVKFKDMNVAKLFSFKGLFNEFVIRYLEFSESRRDSDKYKDRAMNNYCRADYSIGNVKCQLKGYGNRYTAINLASMRKHGTLEFRILPYQASVTEAKKSLEWLVETIEDLLNLKEGLLTSRRVVLNGNGVKDGGVIKEIIKVGEMDGA